MPDHPPRRVPRPDQAAPPPAGLPQKFPEAMPLSDDGLEAAKKESASTMKPSPSGAGEDPRVESGVPDNDPEQPEKMPER